MHIDQGKMYLITTSEWFVGPDGDNYRAVYGKATAKEVKDEMGFKPNARNANWYVKVEGDSQHMVIAGCQVKYAVRTDEQPTIKIMPENPTEADERKYRNDILILK